MFDNDNDNCIYNPSLYNMCLQQATVYYSLNNDNKHVCIMPQQFYTMPFRMRLIKTAQVTKAAYLHVNVKIVI